LLEVLDPAIDRVRLGARPNAPQATALGDALRYGAELLAEALDCDRRFLDGAGDGASDGDGRNNVEITVLRTWEREDFTGITVNGLAVGAQRPIRWTTSARN
jgi:hypothetical protein